MQAVPNELSRQMQDAIPEALQLSISPRIRALTMRVVAAVNFHDEPVGGSKEVDDSLAKHHLPSETSAQA